MQLVLHLSLVLLCQNAYSATPERQRLKTLEHAYQYKSPPVSNTPYAQREEPVKLLRVQQQQKYEPTNFNGIGPFAQNYRNADYERPLYAADEQQHDYFKALQQQQQQQRDIDNIYHAAKQKYKHQYSLPTNAYQLPQNAISQASRPPLASEIVYAREALPQYQSGVAASTAQAANKHKSHSNQLLHAPERQREKDTRLVYTNQLPYPPSFISITSTTTTQSPPYNMRQRSADTDKNDIKQFPDIFAKRQHISLLDSYIPSWVMLRMQQQHKRQQQKQFHKFVATHTLAYPISKKYAQK